MRAAFVVQQLAIQLPQPIVPAVLVCSPCAFKSGTGECVGLVLYVHVCACYSVCVCVCVSSESACACVDIPHRVCVLTMKLETLNVHRVFLTACHQTCPSLRAHKLAER